MCRAVLMYVSKTNDLQNAVNELNMAEHDKGGHREAAVGLAQQAINLVS
jgi:hypothetical protein